jgi:hypothetical protein
LIAKRVFKKINIKDQKNFDEVFQRLLNISQEIQDDKTLYFLLKEDFDIIQKFFQKKIECN